MASDADPGTILRIYSLDVLDARVRQHDWSRR
jgi:hypothetical protein